MEGGIGSVILGFIIWKATGNIWIGAIAATILWPLINAIFGPITRSIQMIGVKTPPFYVLMEHCEDPDTAGKGARVLIMTRPEIAALPEPERLNVYGAIYADGASRFSDKDAFKQRMLSLQKDNLPLRVCASACKIGHMPSMTKCFSIWYKMLADEPFQTGENDKDTFIEDLTCTVPGQNGKQKAAIAFFFDKNMSVGEAADGAAAELPPCPVFQEGIREIAAKA